MKTYCVYYEANDRDHEQYLIVAANNKREAKLAGHIRIRNIGDIERYLITHVDIRIE